MRLKALMCDLIEAVTTKLEEIWPSVGTCTACQFDPILKLAHATINDAY